MNLLQQFQAIFKNETRSVAKITATQAGGYLGQTTAKNPVTLKGAGYTVGQTVFYDTQTGQILEVAPDLELVELSV